MPYSGAVVSMWERARTFPRAEVVAAVRTLHAEFADGEATSGPSDSEHSPEIAALVRRERITFLQSLNDHGDGRVFEQAETLTAVIVDLVLAVPELKSFTPADVTSVFAVFRRAVYHGEFESTGSNGVDGARATVIQALGRLGLVLHRHPTP